MATKLITLVSGQPSRVDEEDFPLLSRHHWYFSDGYAITTIAGKTVRMHRLIMNPPQGLVVDHINKDGLDNRKENLRICTQKENTRNRSKSVKNKSGYTGVNWCSGRTGTKNWQASICVDGKKIHLGRFYYPADAADAYDKAAKKYFGEFASTNSGG